MLQFNSDAPDLVEILDKNLRQFEKEVERIVKTSTFSAEGYAKQLAQVKTGRLRSSIQSRFEDGGLTGIVEARAAHAAYVEYDTRPHIIRPKTAKMLRFKNRRGEWVFAKQVMHPGTKAQPFMRPALAQEGPYFRRDLADLAGRVMSR